MSAVEPAIIVLSEAGLPVARRVAKSVDGTVHGARRRVDADKADLLFDDLGDHLRALYGAGTPIVAVMAAGALVRLLAPALADKTSEPPVIAVADDGSAVVPLLGGHRGANDLARRAAAALGVSAAITTAGDVRFGVALDAPPEGYVLANRDHGRSGGGPWRGAGR